MTDDHDATTASPTNHGPALLAERPITAIAVHLLGMATLAAGPAAAYPVSEHEFTRENARNATNWQLFFLLAALAGIAALAALFGVSELRVPDAVPVPAVVGAAVGFVLVLLVVAAFAVLVALWLMALVFPLLATGKAVFGEAWTYPLAPDVVGWIEARARGRPPWRLVLAGYVILVPVAAGSLVAATVEGEAFVAVAAVLVVIALVGSGVTAAALYRDARALRRANAAWRRNWLAFLAPPAVAGAGTALLARPLWGSANPPGDARYAAMAMLWLTTIGYLLLGRVRVSSP